MKHQIFLGALLCYLMTPNTLSADELGDRSISDVQSMILRTDGKYDVLCKNGTNEIVTMEQIRNDKVCGAVVPGPTVDVEAIFSRSEKDFFILCKNKSWEIATAQAVHQGKVCGGQGCSGFSYEGACWFAGAEGGSCKDACSSRGLVYDPRTANAGRDYDSCATVARGVLRLEGPILIGPAGEGREFLGCYYFAGLGQLYQSTQASANAHHDFDQRMCACK